MIYEYSYSTSTRTSMMTREAAVTVRVYALVAAAGCALVTPCMFTPHQVISPSKLVPPAALPPRRPRRGVHATPHFDDTTARHCCPAPPEQYRTVEHQKGVSASIGHLMVMLYCSGVSSIFDNRHLQLGLCHNTLKISKLRITHSTGHGSASYYTLSFLIPRSRPPCL